MASQLTNIGKAAMRVGKNYTKGYSDVQIKIREATSNDPWGPSGTQMNEIAQMSYSQNEFVEIMEMLDKRLNDKGKNWRHVFKALTLLDYILHAGSENVVIYFRDNMYIVKTLKEFVYVDEDGKDLGSNVRQKAKDITNLLMDEDRLRSERRSRGAMRDRMLGSIADSGLKGEGDLGERGEYGRRPGQGAGGGQSGFKPVKAREEDDDLQRAMAASLQQQYDDEAKRRSRGQEDDDLRKALALSEEEEAKRKREQEDANARALFDDSQQVQPQHQQYNNNLVDVGWNQQQQQLQPQYTSFNPFLQQQMMQQQQEEFMRQQMMLQEQERQRQEWLAMQQQQAMMQQQQQQALLAQPTGYRSNNPFAPNATPSQPTPQPQPQQQQQPQMSLISEEPDFSLFNTPVPQQQPQQQQQIQAPPAPAPAKGFNVKTKDTNPELAALFANREGGLDTFGNIGALRIPVGSAFHESNRQAVQQQGAGAYSQNNPFARNQQQQQGQTGGGGAGQQPFFSV